MNCVRCGNEIDSGARFCPHCGAEQAAVPPPAKKTGGKRRPTALLRLAALAGELSLLCGLVSCGGEDYTGIDIFEDLISTGTSGLYWEDSLILLLCAAGAVLVLLLSLSRQRWAMLGTAVIALISAAGVVGEFVYYRFFSDAFTILYGAYLMAASYLVMAWAAVIGYLRGRKDPDPPKK